MSNFLDSFSATVSAFFRGLMIVGIGATVLYLVYRLLLALATH